jgi:hypothetical protein
MVGTDLKKGVSLHTLRGIGNQDEKEVRGLCSITQKKFQ